MEAALHSSPSKKEKGRQNHGVCPLAARGKCPHITPIKSIFSPTYNFFADNFVALTLSLNLELRPRLPHWMAPLFAVTEEGTENLRESQMLVFNARRLVASLGCQEGI